MLPSRRVEIAALALAVLLTTTGVLHFVTPDGFRSIVPKFVGSATFWVAASGAAEIGCAILLAARPSRRLGGWAAALLFVAVYPANITMLVHAIQGHGDELISWLRLPLQLPLVAWAVYVARGGVVLRTASARTRQ